MNLAEKMNQKIEEIDKFYGNDGNNSALDNFERLKKHRFLIYSSSIGYLWKIAYGGALALSLFDNGEYTALKTRAMLATAPAIPLSAMFYGAFWAKLGSKKLLKESWKKSKKETIKNIFYSHLVGNVLHQYYKFHIGTDIVLNCALLGLEKACEKDNAFSRLAFKTFEDTAKTSLFYLKHIMPRI